ncbi:MAG: DUF2125 domain-containing protein [Pseudomonadota bacterium]
MQRILIIVIAVIALVVGGWSALWFANRSTVEDQMRAALATLTRAGAPNSYDAIEVSGFPFGYRGAVNNLVFRGQDADVAFPQVAAEVSIEDTDTVRLLMPSAFTVTTKSVAVGGPSQTINVAADSMTMAVSLAGEGAYDLALSAAKLVGTPEGEGPVEPFEVEALSASGVFSADPAAPRLDLAAEAASYQQRFIAPGDEASPDGPMPGVARFTNPTLRVDGSAAELTTSAGAQTTLIEFDAGGVMEMRGLQYDVSAKAKDAFDASPLAGAADFETALQVFTEIATRGVLEGGAARASAKIDGLQGTGVIEGEQSSADIGAMALSVDFGADRVALEIVADKLLLDVALPDDQDVFYDTTDLEAKLSAAPATAFDFSPAVTAPAAQMSELIAMAIWGEVLQGGALEATSSAGPTVTRAPSDASAGPFRRVESTAGPSSTRLSLTPDAAVAKVTADTISYRVSEGLEAGGAVEGFELDFFAPLRAGPDEQTATLLLELATVTLDDSVWEMIDPEGGLEREIDGVKVNAEAGVTVMRDVLSPEADLMNLANPVAIPGAVKISDTFLDMMGLRADLAGELAVFPLPSGALALDVAGWPEFLAAALNTPFGSDPQTGNTLIMLNNFYTTYAASPAPADGAEDSAEDGADAAPEGGPTRFDIEFGPAGLTVNGQPFQG